jgi:ABC-type transport system involved in multi-copper enzyme maturation permease subunit
MMQFWALIVDSFRESRDRKIFWVMLVLSVLVAAVMFCFSFEQGKVNVLFGMWVIETDYFTGITGIKTDVIAALVVDGIMDTALGGMGVLLSIIATASFFPTFLDRGAIDVVLCKPMPRWKLFLGRYVGGMVFMGVQATIFVVLTFLVVGLRWGVWLPGYLLAIPLVVLLFSYLYCISALVAVVTRSTVAAVLLTMLAWMAFTGVQSVDDLFTSKYPKWQENKLVYEGVHAARWIVPKTQDIIYLAKKWSRAANASVLVHADNDDDREMVDWATKVEIARREMNPLAIIGSSLLFEAAIVLAAMWKFSRRDY